MKLTSNAILKWQEERRVKWLLASRCRVGLQRALSDAFATNDEVDGSPSTASKCQKGVRYDTDEGSHP
jgi:hypothetical protein